MTAMTCLCHFTVFFRARKVQAWRISSFSKAETLITQQSRNSGFANPDLKYKVRIATLPDIVMLCEIRAGIQTAR
jgi:hypothetical protein